MTGRLFIITYIWNILIKIFWHIIISVRYYEQFFRPNLYLFTSFLKFIYSVKATKFYEIFPLLLTVWTVVKSKGKISQDVVAFSACMNFMSFALLQWLFSFLFYCWKCKKMQKLTIAVSKCNCKFTLRALTGFSFPQDCNESLKWCKIDLLKYIATIKTFGKIETASAIFWDYLGMFRE